MAFAAHAAHAYGGMQSVQRVKGGLAPWQERRSKEMIAADPSGATSLAAVAEACGLSVGYFSRAFRKTTGLAPHTWLQHARVERAMTMLRGTDKSLSEIALACGFSDQSHFTRVFTQRVVPRRVAEDLSAIAKPKARFGQKTPTCVRFIQASPPETVSASRSSAGGLSAKCRPRRRSDALETIRMRLQLGQFDRRIVVYAGSGKIASQHG